MQAEELKARLQSAEIHSACQQGKVKQLTNVLERQIMQTESLKEQVENLKNKPLQEESGITSDEVTELKDLLEQERAKHFQEQNMKLQLCKELEESKEQLAHQKSLKEMFIIKEKETRSELERLTRLSDPETINAMRIATEVGNDIKKKQKKELQRDLEELKVAHIISQEKFATELQVEKDRNKVLQQGIEQVMAVYQVNLRFESELKAEKEKSDSLLKQLEEMIQIEAVVSEELQVIRQLSADTETLLHRLQNQQEKLAGQTPTKQEPVTELQAEEEVGPGPGADLTELREEQEDEGGEQEDESPSIMCRMLCCRRRPKFPRNGFRRRERNAQPEGDTVLEEEEGGEAEAQLSN